MEKRTEEWLRQSEYDIDTAHFIYQGGRYLYAVFMCHLALEKAMKGLYYERRRVVPPKTHSLVYLLGQAGVNPPETLARAVIRLSEASIPTRYPEDLKRVQALYPREVVQEILDNTNEVLAWIKAQL